MNPEQEILSYQDTIDFINAHPTLSLNSFEDSVSYGLNLFSTGAEFDFDTLEKNCDLIQKSLPACKRIFKKPIIHLIEEEKIVPVEAAGSINNKSVNHLSTHPELWSKVEKSGLTPRKLLSKTYEDNYAIYENLVFVSYVDKVLSYCRKNLSALRNLMYASKTLNINLLDRNNHRNYYKALGQLQIGYIRNYDQFSIRAEECMVKLESIISTLTSRLRRPVYAKCHKLHKKFTLHKTNILGMQKDYHKVYSSYRALFKSKKEDIIETKAHKVEEGYFSFVEALTMFAILNYGFKPITDTSVEFNHLCIAFSYKDFNLEVTSLEDRGILFTFHKEKDYTILFNMVGDKQLGEQYDKQYMVDESEDNMLISITDIQSFRRIQQVLLEGMIYSDEIHDTCPFCGEKMEYNKKLKKFICKSCHETIQEKKCNEKDALYYETGIYGFKPKPFTGDNAYEEKRYYESLYRYRNITKINKEGLFCCPKCSKVHE